MNSPILITGAARSGTSLVAGAIHKSGAWGGQMSGPTHNNRKGMFENHQIRNQIVKPYLRTIGMDHLGQYPLPDIDRLSIPHDWKDQVLEVMQQQGLKEHQPWMYKGAKMCLMWPIWEYAFPNAKWIIVRRRTEDIVRSCLHTGFMKRFRRRQFQEEVGAANEAEAWEWWVHQHIERFRQMINHGLNVKVVRPERMVVGDYTQIYDAVEWCGLEWNSQIVAEFIDPKLWHSRQERKE